MSALEEVGPESPSKEQILLLVIRFIFFGNKLLIFAKN